jgi:hypothetical protein
MKAVRLILMFSILLMALAGCTSDDGSPEAPEDTDNTPPVMTGSSPHDSETGVSRTGPYWFAFNEEMDVESVQDNIDASPDFGHDIHANSSADTFWLTPHVALAGSSPYEFNVGPACEDLAGNRMGSLVSIDFTTTAAQDMDPPTVESTVPIGGATGVNPGDPLRITFSEPVSYPGSWDTQTGIEIVPYPDDGYFERQGSDLLVWHYPFPVDSLIEVTVTTDMTDISGNNLEADHTFSFRTLNDTTRPFLASSVPTVGNTNVSSSISMISATFSEPMFANFDMPAEDVDARMILALSEEPEWNAEYTTVTLTLERGLLPGCLYSVFFRDVTDWGGNVIDPNPTHFWFRTSGEPSYYPIRTGYLWYFMGGMMPVAKMPGIDMGSDRRAIENYNSSSGEFEEVWYEWDEGVWVIREKTFLRNYLGMIQHIGREEYDNGVLEETMMWDSPMTFLRMPPQDHLGESWTVGSTADMGEGMSLSISGEIGISASTFDVFSPLADAVFRDCLKWSFSAEVTWYDNGTPGGGDEFIVTYFLSEGVGLVMIIDENLTAPSEPDTMFVSGWDLD